MMKSRSDTKRYCHGKMFLALPAAPGEVSSISNRRSRSLKAFCEGLNMLMLESDLPL